jgi:hypothetical protein
MSDKIVIYTNKTEWYYLKYPDIKRIIWQAIDTFRTKLSHNDIRPLSRTFWMTPGNIDDK